jgi:hypothetical protein
MAEVDYKHRIRSAFPKMYSQEPNEDGFWEKQKIWRTNYYLNKPFLLLFVLKPEA